MFGNRWVALALTVSFSALALFLFLLSVYYRLTNARLTRREILPGAIIGAFFLELTLQLLPLFVLVTSDVVALQALGTTFLLLVWFYVMANVIVFGAALNYERAYGRTGRTPRPKRAEKPTPGIANDQERRPRMELLRGSGRSRRNSGFAGSEQLRSWWRLSRPRASPRGAYRPEGPGTCALCRGP